MKKIVSILAIFMLVAVLLTACNIQRIGKDNLYIEVIEPTETKEDSLDGGELITRYIYKQKAFDEEGESVDVEFSAGRELRQGAYLMLYLKSNDEVTSYDEVTWDDIPNAAQVELENYYSEN
ncbi:hypothetical protein JCM21714_3979 [Gracilibacillus boraciitolerans JCM 21714]|uniref:YxeA family protein n=1 Tax=Gracilibacillus boraciitolerans JCM 21714 TaxID=1298598 RepID=W4VPV7_9BACI|nr:YxeA family protein [Gracilibacillus boraciitolerans]GAE94789.1 hypothetical protein JCM21714_3979 [Gracilibacillus boraciitolerans JCM 21714]